LNRFSYWFLRNAEHFFLLKILVFCIALLLNVQNWFLFCFVHPLFGVDRTKEVNRFERHICSHVFDCLTPFFDSMNIFFLILTQLIETSFYLTRFVIKKYSLFAFYLSRGRCLVVSNDGELKRRQKANYHNTFTIRNWRFNTIFTNYKASLMNKSMSTKTLQNRHV